MFSSMQVKIEIQHKMKIFGDQLQTQMNEEDDHVKNDDTFQVLQISILFWMQFRQLHEVQHETSWWIIVKWNMFIL